MRRWLVVGLFGVLLTAATASGQQMVTMKVPAPELEEIGDWVNTKPLKLADLKGKVVVLHFWTFG